MIKPRWFASFVAEDTQPSVISIQARHTHLLSVTHPLFPHYLLLLVPCRCFRFFHRLSARHEREREKKKQTLIQISLMILYICVISSSPRGNGVLPLPVHASNCAAGRCRFLCDLRGRLTGALQRRLRKRKRLNENVV